MEKVIQKLCSLPKGDTILLWVVEKAKLLGIKGRKLQYLESVAFVIAIQKLTLTKTLNLSSALATTGTSKSTVGYLQMKKSIKDLKHHNLSGLAKDLGITKEGAQRLIWLLDDVQNTKNGSRVYSSETISLVRNALLKERILKQTTIQLGSPLSWMKKESQPTNMQWRVNAYGIKVMGGHFVGSAIGVSNLTS